MEIAIKRWQNEEWKTIVIATKDLRIISSDFDEIMTSKTIDNLQKFPYEGSRTSFQEEPEAWAKFYSRMNYTYFRVEILS